MLSHGLLPDTELLEKMFPTTLDMKNPYKVQKKKKKKIQKSATDRMTYNYIYVGVKHCRDNNKKEKGLPCKMQKMCPIINIVPKIFTWKNLHSVKSVQIRSFFWSVFSRIQTEYEEILVSLCIQSECGKIWTRKNSVLGHFSLSDCQIVVTFKNF